MLEWNGHFTPQQGERAPSELPPSAPCGPISDSVSYIFARYLIINDHTSAQPSYKVKISNKQGRSCKRDEELLISNSNSRSILRIYAAPVNHHVHDCTCHPLDLRQTRSRVCHEHSESTIATSQSDPFHLINQESCAELVPPAFFTSAGFQVRNLGHITLSASRSPRSRQCQTRRVSAAQNHLWTHLSHKTPWRMRRCT